MKGHIDWGTLLRARGYRLTPQRLLILESLQAMTDHATAEDVYARVQEHSSAVNRATVYRTLQFLCSMGIVTSTSGTGGHLLYEMARSEPHHHLVCSQCGTSLTMEHTLVAPLLRQIETSLHFRVSDTLHLSLYGVCEKCE